MDDLRPNPEQSWSATREIWKDRLLQLLAAIGALSALGIVLALVLPDRDAPSQENFERCIDKAADKAHGAVSIFNQLRSTQCDKLRPHPKATLKILDAPMIASRSSDNEDNDEDDQNDECYGATRPGKFTDC